MTSFERSNLIFSFERLGAAQAVLNCYQTNNECEDFPVICDRILILIAILLVKKETNLKFYTLLVENSVEFFCFDEL